VINVQSSRSALLRTSPRISDLAFLACDYGWRGASWEETPPPKVTLRVSLRASSSFFSPPSLPPPVRKGRLSHLASGISRTLHAQTDSTLFDFAASSRILASLAGRAEKDCPTAGGAAALSPLRTGFSPSYAAHLPLFIFRAFRRYGNMPLAVANLIHLSLC